MPPEKGGGGLRGERGGRLVYYAERSYNIGWFGIFFCSVLLIVWAAVLTDPTYAQQQQQQKQLQYYQSESQQQEYQPEAQPQQPSQQQQLLAYTNLDRTVQLASDRSRYDSADLSAAEVQGSAVSAFCKSFSFLCHIRCLQRGDPRDAGNVGPNNCGSTSPGTDSRGGIFDEDSDGNKDQDFAGCDSDDYADKGCLVQYDHLHNHDHGHYHCDCYCDEYLRD
ncbi:hypothetical protein K457DRAFT_151011 [Linnemannia elongata AG-77]|uniref:Uncharacterized protein n=1 Tax=Linnemannia elongata AG-77 TaxID=1314771 RepID=A0A197KEY2_9FUNG|nr:hypothetical protein K457DRAFT_151011 [Linnemannia elongata AG-77]